MALRLEADPMYQLLLDENTGDGIRRVALEQLDGALASLRGDGDRNEAIHDARKRCKKLRAALRLAREGLGEDSYRAQNAVFRDAARLLSGARDRWVLVETVDALQARYGEHLGPGTLAPVREQLALRHRIELERLLEVERADQRAAAALEQARAAVAGWRLDEATDVEIALAGVRRVFRQGRRALARAERELGTAAFHEWRKQAKYLWYHARLLRGCAGEGTATLADRLERLSRQLGEEHDLAVLQAELRGDRTLTRGTAHLQVLLGVAGQRRSELREAALTLGRRLYRSRPRAIAVRLERQWRRVREGGHELSSGSEVAAREGQASRRAGGAVAQFDPARRTQSSG